MKIMNLKPGQQAILSSLTVADPRLERRLEAMGFKQGQVIKLLRAAPFNGPVHVRVGLTTEVAMRRSEAEGLELVSEHEWLQSN
ncbi:MAG: FeoA family protein [Cyanobacteria bacterium P01_H01_bin.15]